MEKGIGTSSKSSLLLLKLFLTDVLQYFCVNRCNFSLSKVNWLVKKKLYSLIFPENKIIFSGQVCQTYMCTTLDSQMEVPYEETLQKRSSGSVVLKQFKDLFWKEKSCSLKPFHIYLCVCCLLQNKQNTHTPRSEKTFSTLCSKIFWENYWI